MDYYKKQDNKKNDFSTILGSLAQALLVSIASSNNNMTPNIKIEVNITQLTDFNGAVNSELHLRSGVTVSESNDTSISIDDVINDLNLERNNFLVDNPYLKDVIFSSVDSNFCPSNTCIHGEGNDKQGYKVSVDFFKAYEDTYKLSAKFKIKEYNGQKVDGEPYLRVTILYKHKIDDINSIKNLIEILTDLRNELHKHQKH